MLRKAAEKCNELFVLMDVNTEDKSELYSYKVELEQISYINHVLVKDGASTDGLPRDNCIDAVAIEDTPENRGKYENINTDYEIIFIK